MSQTVYDIEGLNCASCVGRVQLVLQDLPHVKNAQVNLLMGEASIEGVQSWSEKLSIAQVITDAGYPAKIRETTQDFEEKEEKSQAELQRLKRQTYIAIALTLPVFLLEMGLHVWPDFHHWVLQNFGQRNIWMLQALLTSVVMFWPGRSFYRLGLKALMQRHPDMNSLVALGTLAAWGYSMIALLVPHVLPVENRFVYFESAAVIVSFILLGRYFEARAKGQTGAAISALMDLQSKTARVWRNEAWVEITPDQLKINDLVQVRPGETLPCDGLITQGHSDINESMLTGESLPRSKSVGDSVIGGSLNGSGGLTVQVTQANAHSTLARIIDLVQQAQSAQLPVQQLVDRISYWFVPAVIALALATFVFWQFMTPMALPFSLVSAIAVLIVACPCAMGLATPTSILIASGRGAQAGVLFAKGSALQQLQNVQDVVFDKTGTLTKGSPLITDFQCAEAGKSQHILALCAAVEQQSEHPLAAAVLDFAQAQNIALPEAQNIKAFAGRGATAQVGAHEVSLGNTQFMQELGVDISAVSQHISDFEAQGKTLILAAVDQRIAAVFAASDTLKAQAGAVVEALQKQGLRVHMLSGDNRNAAHHVARKLGITSVRAQATPEEKHAFLKQLQGPVAFVGDGINDAPALAAADVGIAIGSGTDIAIEAADVVLMSANLQGITRAMKISRATLKNIKQNLFWAFGYNILLIPIAAGLLYPAFGLQMSPQFAAAAMACSSIFVLLNALRLRRLKWD